MTCRRGLCSLSRIRSVGEAQLCVMKEVVRSVQRAGTCFSKTRNTKKSRIHGRRGRAFDGCDYWSSELHWLMGYKIVGSALKNRFWNTCLFWLLPYIQSYSLSWRETVSASRDRRVGPGIRGWWSSFFLLMEAWAFVRSWPCGPAVHSHRASQLCVYTHTHTHTSAERALNF